MSNKSKYCRLSKEQLGIKLICVCVYLGRCCCTPRRRTETVCPVKRISLFCKYMIHLTSQWSGNYWLTTARRSDTTWSFYEDPGKNSQHRGGSETSNWIKEVMSQTESPDLSPPLTASVAIKSHKVQICADFIFVWLYPLSLLLFRTDMKWKPQECGRKANRTKGAKQKENINFIF